MPSQAMNLGNAILSKSNKVFYAVGRGKETGVYERWNDCWNQINKFPNAKYRKFNDSQQAEEFVNFWRKHSALAKNSVNTKSEVVPAENTEKIIKSVKPLEIQRKTTKQPKISPQLFPSVSDLQVSYLSSNYALKKEDLKKPKPSEVNLDSFKTVFDGCFKEICAISSAVSSLKLDIEKLKDSLNYNLLATQIKPQKMGESFSEIKSEENEEIPEILSLKSCSVKTKKKVKVSEEPENNMQVIPAEKVKKKVSSAAFPKDTEKKATIKKSKAVSSAPKIKNEIENIPFLYDEDGYVKVFTDGSVLSRKNGGNGGIGVWFGEDNPLNLSLAVDGSPTNNLVEIRAARMAVQQALKVGIKHLKIFTDSLFLINCATKWIYRWKKNSWTSFSGEPVKHKEELQNLYFLTCKLKVKWEKVPGHAGIKGNESADRLAYKGCHNVKLLASSAVTSQKKTFLTLKKSQIDEKKSSNCYKLQECDQED